MLNRHVDVERIDTQLYRLRRYVSKRLQSRRFVRFTLLSVNALMLVGVFAYISTQSSEATGSLNSSLAQTGTTAPANPLDQLSAADIAVNIAEVTRLPETTAVTNQADSVNAQLSSAPVTNTVIAKPQEVATAFKSRFDIQSYVVQAGDTVASIAAKFNVTSNSIEWSNSLTGNTVAAGTKLLIPPVNGVVYTVKAGDTAQSLAQKFSADQAQITAFNDAELTGLQAGEQIVIPNGQPPAQASSFGSGFNLFTSGALAASYGGFGDCIYGGKAYSNYGYDCGFCTWWVAMKRAVSGNPVPSNLGEAYSWRYTAASMGIPEGNAPQPGAVMWFPDDHVAYVESVASDGTVTISEMNHLGWGVVDTRTFPASQAGSYTYIY